MRRSAAILAAAALALAACGTTVPLASQRGQLGTATVTADQLGTTGGPQLSLPSAADPAAEASDPAVAAPATAAVTASAPLTATAGGASDAPVTAQAGVQATTRAAAGGGATPKASGRAAAAAKTSGVARTTAPKAGQGATSTAAASSAPISIGLTYQDNSTSVGALGGTGQAAATEKEEAEALVAGLNATGGVAGHQLKAVPYSFNTNDSNYSEDATAACATFTQDNHVPIVIDLAFGTVGGFQSCLQKAGVTDVSIFDDGDSTSDAANTLHANPLYLTLDRAYAAVLKQFTATGYLTKTNQLGIILDQCSEDTAAYNNTVLPLITSLGLKKPVTAALSCTSGFSSAGSASAPLANAVLSFRSSGVDRVMVVSNFEGVYFGLFAVAASAQGYKPGYALSSNGQARFLEKDIPADQLPQMTGVGNVPGYDVDDTGAKPSAVESRCLQIAAAGQFVPSSYGDREQLYWECAAFLLFGAAMTADGGNPAPQAIVPAIAGLGTTFVGPGVVGNSTAFSSTRHDGPAQVQVFGYAAACSCVRYVGSPVAA